MENVVKIHLYPMDCRLEASPEIVSLISEKLTFTVEGSQFSQLVRQGKWDGKKRFLVRPYNKFKAGLVPRIIELIPEGTIIQILDYRVNVKKFDKIPYEYTLCGETKKVLRDYQVDAVNSVLTRTLLEEVPFTRGTINIATNGGKTVIASAIIQELLKKSDGRILFLTHSKEIGRQARESFRLDLGIEVGFIGDGEWDANYQVVVCLIPTLVRNLKKERFIDLVENAVGYIADEVHHSSSTTWHQVLLAIKACEVRIGLTGTVDSKKPISEHLLYEVTSTKAVVINNQYLIDAGVSSKPHCYFVPVKTPVKTYDNYADAYRQVITCNEKRNIYVCKLIEKEYNSGKNVLVMVEHLEHGESILDILQSEHKTIDNVVFTHGGKSSEFRQKVLTDLRAGKLRVVIATSIFDEGVDVSGLHAIIYARGGKSFRKVLQSIGRILRKKEDSDDVNVYDFVDYGDPILFEHSKERYKIMAKQGFKVEVLSKF